MTNKQSKQTFTLPDKSFVKEKIQADDYVIQVRISTASCAWDLCGEQPLVQLKVVISTIFF